MTPLDHLIRLLGDDSADPHRPGAGAEPLLGGGREWLDRRMSALPTAARRRCAAEIGALLARDLCENQLRDLLAYEVGCGYAPEAEGLDASGWLREVRSRLVESVRVDPERAVS